MKSPELDLHLIGQDLGPYVQRTKVVLNEKTVPYRMTVIDLAAKPASVRESVGSDFEQQLVESLIKKGNQFSRLLAERSHDGQPIGSARNY